MVIRWALSSVLCSLMSGCWCVNSLEQFHQIAALTGMDCLYSEQAFSVTTPLGLFECARKCVERWQCRGIFYAESVRLCHGCTTVYDASYQNALSVYVPYIGNAIYYAYPRLYIFGNSRYEITVSKQNFEESVDLCTSMGGFIVTIETEEENNYAKQLAKELDLGDVFIGLHQPGGFATDWIWQTTGTAMGFDDFGPTEPSNADEHCVALYGSISYQWVDILCSTQLSVMCEFQM